MKVTDRRRWLRARIQLAIGLAATFVGWVATATYHPANLLLMFVFIASLAALTDNILNDLN